jgi:hypothetical protein
MFPSNSQIGSPVHNSRSAELRKKRASDYERGSEQKPSMDQSGRQRPFRVASNLSAEISENSERLRNFGGFYLLRVRSLAPDFRHPTDPLSVSSATTALAKLACFLRDDGGGVLLDADHDSATTQGERHETSDPLAIAAGWHRRPEYAGSQRRRMCCRRLPGRLRRAPWRRRGAAGLRCSAGSRRRAPQGILIFVRCILGTIALATIPRSIAPTGAQSTNSPAAATSSARELVIGTNEASQFQSMQGRKL